MTPVPLTLREGRGYFQYQGTPIAHDGDDPAFDGLVTFTSKPAGQQAMLQQDNHGAGTKAIIFSSSYNAAEELAHGIITTPARGENVFTLDTPVSLEVGPRYGIGVGWTPEGIPPTPPEGTTAWETASRLVVTQYNIDVQWAITGGSSAQQTTIFMPFELRTADDVMIGAGRSDTPNAFDNTFVQDWFGMYDAFTVVEGSVWLHSSEGVVGTDPARVSILGPATHTGRHLRFTPASALLGTVTVTIKGNVFTTGAEDQYGNDLGQAGNPYPLTFDVSIGGSPGTPTQLTGMFVSGGAFTISGQVPASAAVDQSLYLSVYDRDENVFGNPYPVYPSSTAIYEVTVDMQKVSLLTSRPGTRRAHFS